MSVPVHTLNPEQKVWYANVVIAAILADDEISPSEVDFLKQVIVIVENPAKKKELMAMISAKNKPEITPPKGISNEILAAIFIELMLIMISDLDFADDEKDFLKNTADLFKFEKSYFIELMRWAEEGLDWKTSQQYLLSDSERIENFQVPIAKMNSAQRKWYSQTLISTIMLDGAVDSSELSFLKAAVSFVDNRKDQMELMGYVRNKMAPRLIAPPAGIPEFMLTIIFIEIIKLVSADESLSYSEQAHLKQISDLSGFSPSQYEKLIDWCNTGISWMQNKNPLITNCKITKTSLSESSGAQLQPNKDNNSIVDREFECFLCESKQKVPYFQLKPHTQEPSRNIFGIVTYMDSLEGNDYIDYNLIRTIVCPYCFFATTSKDLFKKNPKEKLPVIFSDRKFKSEWIKTIKQRKAVFNDHIKDLFKLKRSGGTVVKTYQLAIKTSEILADVNRDESQKWQVVTLTLTLAEIFINNGKEKRALEYLNKAKEKAKLLFKNATDVNMSFRSARLLFFISLYENDTRTAGTYYDFISGQMDPARFGSLKKQQQAVIRKIHGETKKALEDRSEYKKENLIGFHRNI